MVQDFDINGLNWMDENSSTKIDVNGISLAGLMPSLSRQKEILLSNIVKLTEAEYQANMLRIAPVTL